MAQKKFEEKLTYLLQRCSYQEKAFVKQAVLDAYPTVNMELNVSSYFDDNGLEYPELLQLKVVMPINGRDLEVTQVPVEVYLTYDFPIKPPVAIVKSTREVMYVANHPNISKNGIVQISYIEKWSLNTENKGYFTVTGLIDEITQEFNTNGFPIVSRKTKAHGAKFVTAPIIVVSDSPTSTTTNTSKPENALSSITASMTLSDAEYDNNVPYGGPYGGGGGGGGGGKATVFQSSRYHTTKDVIVVKSRLGFGLSLQQRSDNEGKLGIVVVGLSSLQWISAPQGLPVIDHDFLVEINNQSLEGKSFNDLVVILSSIKPFTQAQFKFSYGVGAGNPNFNKFGDTVNSEENTIFKPNELLLCKTAQGFGISISNTYGKLGQGTYIEGIDPWIQIMRHHHDSSACQEAQSLPQLGDLIVEINDQNIDGLDQVYIVAILRSIPVGGVVKLKLKSQEREQSYRFNTNTVNDDRNSNKINMTDLSSYLEGVSQGESNNGSSNSDDLDDAMVKGVISDITLVKSTHGFGFTIEELATDESTQIRVLTCDAHIMKNPPGEGVKNCLVKNDVILAVNGQSVEYMSTVLSLLSNIVPNSNTTFKVKRIPTLNAVVLMKFREGFGLHLVPCIDKTAGRELAMINKFENAQFVSGQFGKPKHGDFIVAINNHNVEGLPFNSIISMFSDFTTFDQVTFTLRSNPVGFVVESRSPGGGR